MWKECASQLASRVDADNVLSMAQLALERPCSCLEEAVMKVMCDHWKTLYQSGTVQQIMDLNGEFVAKAVALFK